MNEETHRSFATSGSLAVPLFTQGAAYWTLRVRLRPLTKAERRAARIERKALFRRARARNRRAWKADLDFMRSRYRLPPS